MGIKNIKLLLKKYAADSVSTKKLSNYEKKIIAIDVSIYLYQYTYIYKDPVIGFSEIKRRAESLIRSKQLIKVIA